MSVTATAIATAAGTGLISTLAGLGAVAAPLTGAAAAAGPIATLATAVGAPIAAGSLAATGVGAGAVATSPHATLGVENAVNDAVAGVLPGSADAINGLSIPGLPHIVVE